MTYISSPQTTIKMHEYDLKIAVSDSLRVLTAEHNAMGFTYQILKESLYDLNRHFESNPEWSVMKRYIFEMCRCRKLFKNQLDGLIESFDRFIIHVKRNSPIEHVFAQTDEEDYLSFCTIQDSPRPFEDDSTRAPPLIEVQSTESSPCEDRVDVTEEIASPTRERKRRIRKSNKKTPVSVRN